MSSGRKQTWDVVVAGGGAAGVFGAIACAEAHPGARILVLEKGRELLAKVRISGGGRCNVTHDCDDPPRLAEHYPRGSRELLSPFYQWQPLDTVAWFASHGVSLKTEADGRMFPVTDQSDTIVRCLLEAARKAGVQFQTRTAFVDLKCTSGNGLVVTDSEGHQHATLCLLVAAGGLKPDRMMTLIQSLGHTIEPLAPSLFTFHIRDPRLSKLQGLSVPQAAVRIPETRWEATGPILVTHWGLSGPAILKLSAWAARWARKKDYRFNCIINWMPGHNRETLAPIIQQSRERNPKKLIRNSPLGDLPQRLWQRLVMAAGMTEDQTWNQVRRGQLQNLADQLVAGSFQVHGKSLFKEEFVTCGGVRLSELDMRSLESRLVPGLYFAGEILDVDGLTGGFNFQAAWTTGWLAGQAMAQSLKGAKSA